MIKTLLKQIGEYKKDTIITPIFTVLEVVAELLVPFVIASLIDKGIEAGNLRNVYLYGALMIVLAFFGLVFGILAGRFAASASSGFACNLRQSMFENIQTFSFSNIDKFSTAGLVTRMTTDVTNMQMAFQMCLRIALRAPLMLICSMVMCLLINAKLSMIFLAAIVVLAVALALIMSKAMKIFTDDAVHDLCDDDHERGQRETDCRGIGGKGRYYEPGIRPGLSGAGRQH